MPRSKKGIKQQPVDKDSHQAAVNSVVDGRMGMRDSCRHFHIKLTTLHRHVKIFKKQVADDPKNSDSYKCISTNAVKSVFSSEHEDKLVQYLKH